jgi:hypothetical protein
MKKLSACIGALLALLLVNAAAAHRGTSDIEVGKVNKHVLLVLVAVDSTGKVTEVDPATDLHPALQRMVEDAVHAMIKAPAKDRHGQARASQLVLALVIEPNKDHPGAFTLAYQSSKEVPVGPLHWIVRPGRGGITSFALATSSPQSDLHSRYLYAKSVPPPPGNTPSH